MNPRSTSETDLKGAGGERQRAPRGSGSAKRQREPRLRERFREETRRALLTAAEQTLARDGLAGARMEAIAQAAGVAVGTVYNYFADREQLISALLELRRSELLHRLSTVAEAASDTSFQVALEGYVRAMLEHFEKHRALFRLLLQEELGSAKKATKGAKHTMLRELMARADQLTALGVKQGALREEDAEFHGVMLLGLLRGVLLKSLDASFRLSLDEATSAVLRLFLSGSGTASLACSGEQTP
jgi:AcrR family transcriptional regulator